MIMTQGNLGALVTRPIVTSFLALAFVSMSVPIILQYLRSRGRSIELEEEQS